MAAKTNRNRNKIPLSEDNDNYDDSIEVAEGAMAAMAEATAKKAGMRRGGGRFSSGEARSLTAALGVGQGEGLSASLLNTMAMPSGMSSNGASFGSLRKRIGAVATQAKTGLGAEG